MDTPTFERDIKHTRDEALKYTAPLQSLWKMTWFDLPLSVASETLRFMGRRMQAHGEHLASLHSCSSMPEMMEVQSHFVRSAIDAYGHESNKIMEDVRGKMSEVRDQVGKAA